MDHNIYFFLSRILLAKNRKNMKENVEGKLAGGLDHGIQNSHSNHSSFFQI